MNHDKENKSSNRTLAVGWFDNAPFRAICQKYVPRIKEVFFAWPGVTASRPMAEWTPERKQLFFEDIAWCRNEGMELDAIFNANCYRAKEMGAADDRRQARVVRRRMPPRQSR